MISQEAEDVNDEEVPDRLDDSEQAWSDPSGPLLLLYCTMISYDQFSTHMTIFIIKSNLLQKTHGSRSFCLCCSCSTIFWSLLMHFGCQNCMFLHKLADLSIP